MADLIVRDTIYVDGAWVPSEGTESIDVENPAANAENQSPLTHGRVARLTPRFQQTLAHSLPAPHEAFAPQPPLAATASAASAAVARQRKRTHN